MLLFFACVFCIILLIVFIIMAFLPASGGTNSSQQTREHNRYTSQNDGSEYERNARAERMLENGDLPDWDDLSDEQKTRISVWSEKGEPLEDLHLFDK